MIHKISGAVMEDTVCLGLCSFTNAMHSRCMREHALPRCVCVWGGKRVQGPGVILSCHLQFGAAHHHASRKHITLLNHIRAYATGMRTLIYRVTVSSSMALALSVILSSFLLLPPGTMRAMCVRGCS